MLITCNRETIHVKVAPMRVTSQRMRSSFIPAFCSSFWHSTLRWDVSYISIVVNSGQTRRNDTRVNVRLESHTIPES